MVRKVIARARMLIIISYFLYALPIDFMMFTPALELVCVLLNIIWSDLYSIFGCAESSKNGRLAISILY
jgi:hypothetical protein